MAAGSYTERFPPPPKKHTAEAHGVVFLPAAGNRLGTDVYSVGSNGNYWSSTPNEDNAYNMNFNSGNVNTNNNNRNNGNAVRLVRSAS